MLLCVFTVPCVTVSLKEVVESRSRDLNYVEDYLLVVSIVVLYISLVNLLVIMIHDIYCNNNITG